jgi:hypothetical protein
MKANDYRKLLSIAEEACAKLKGSEGKEVIGTRKKLLGFQTSALPFFKEHEAKPLERVFWQISNPENMKKMAQSIRLEVIHVCITTFSVHAQFTGKLGFESHISHSEFTSKGFRFVVEIGFVPFLESREASISSQDRCPIANMIPFRRLP